MRRYDIPATWDYHRMRANIYAHCAEVMLEAIEIIDGSATSDLSDVVEPQSESGARYFKQMASDLLTEVRDQLDRRSARAAEAEDTHA